MSQESDAPAIIDRENAVAAYAAYGAAVDWHNHQGRPMPEWIDLPDRQRNAWCAAARTIRERTEDRG